MPMEADGDLVMAVVILEMERSLPATPRSSIEERQPRKGGRRIGRWVALAWELWAVGKMPLLWRVGVAPG